MTTPKYQKIFGKRKVLRLYAVLLFFLGIPFCVLPAEDGSLSFNEIMVANIDCFVDPSWNYGAWAEVYNASNAPCNLRGYWVSDDEENLKKVHLTQSIFVPAHGFKNLWFDHHDKYCPSQIALKLDTEGGTLYLSDPWGKVVAFLKYPSAMPRASWARLNSSEYQEEWGYCNVPTPEADNGMVVPCTERVEAPVVSPASTFFTGSLAIRVTKPTGTQLRYTTDGTTPTLTNGQTSLTGSFAISRTTVFRFALFRDGQLSSPVVTRSYLKKDNEISLPVISVVTDPDNLYSDELGIFVRGVNGRAGRGQSGACNWNMDWDRPTNFEYLTKEGLSVVNQEADILRCGGWNRAHAPYGFKIHAAKVYEGKNYLDATFFRTKPYNRYKTLQMRNGGNDRGGRVTDAFIQKLIQSSGLGVDVQDYEPVAHYINGVYKGVINMREPTNKHYVQANYGLDEDEIDLFEMNCDSGYVQKCGTMDAYDRLYELSKHADDESVYEEIKCLLDIDEFCNYNAVELYLCNWDWPQNNLKGWRPSEEGGRFRFILFDTERAFEVSNPFQTISDKRMYTFDPLYGEAVRAWTAEIKYITIFQNLLQNETFRRHFIDTFCMVAGSVFEESRCRRLIEEWVDYVEPMQVLSDNGYGMNVSPRSSANSLLSRLSSHAPSMISVLKSYPSMKLNNVRPRHVSLSSNISSASLRMNDQVIPTGKFDGQVFPPVTLKAEAPAGYVFDGWKAENAANSLIKWGDTWTYYDQGNLDGAPWTALGYGTSNWKSGQAPLGYGSAGTGYATKVDYGNNAQSKHTTYYFRRNIKLSEAPSANDVFRLDYNVDDGFVMYVNEKEVARYNMPSGEVSFSTLASTYALTDPTAGSMELSGSSFKKGINTIAIEVHNSSGDSSDIYWDAQLTYQKENEPTSSYLSTENTLMIPDEDIVLTAHFSKQTDLSSLCPVVINEVSAGNSIYVNEYSKKGDWIELYNNTDRELDVAGMYLSDELDNPCKYVLSSEGTSVSTLLPPHGHKIIWCDKQDVVSQLHAPFKLSNENGALVMLTAADESWADTLVYCAHDGTSTVGRYPDGTDSLYVMSRPSIGVSNCMTMYTRSYDAPSVIDGINDLPQSSRQGDMSLSYGQDVLHVKGNHLVGARLDVYTMDGVLCMSAMLGQSSGTEHVSVSCLRSGRYVACLTMTSGEKCTIKFIK